MSNSHQTPLGSLLCADSPTPALMDPQACAARAAPSEVPSPGTRARDGTPPLAGRCYVGERGPAGCRVSVVDRADTYALRPRRADPLWSFSWGRPGRSAGELAWSILHDSAGDAGLADDWYVPFATEVIAQLPHDAFRIDSRDVLAWLFEDRYVDRAPQPG
ncbi:MAG: DUF6166 domain-containing protein [Solirubrobacteraceae bacterium]